MVWRRGQAWCAAARWQRRSWCRQTRGKRYRCWWRRCKPAGNVRNARLLCRSRFGYRKLAPTGKESAVKGERVRLLPDPTFDPTVDADFCVLPHVSHVGSLTPVAKRDNFFQLSYWPGERVIRLEERTCGELWYRGSLQLAISPGLRVDAPKADERLKGVWRPG